MLLLACVQSHQRHENDFERLGTLTWYKTLALLPLPSVTSDMKLNPSCSFVVCKNGDFHRSTWQIAGTQ